MLFRSDEVYPLGVTVEFVLALLAGGREAWDRFAKEHRLVVLKAINAAARRFGASEADCDDAVSEVFVELLKEDARALRAWRGESAFTTWLTVIAHRVACREFARKRPSPERREAAVRPPSPEAGVLDELEKLPERERRALVLFHVEEASYQEIAAKLGIPSNQVGMVLLRGREMLAKLLKQRGVL
jgi:RNA polymerase sigma-70 factor (ECF subfamily)